MDEVKELLTRIEALEKTNEILTNANQKLHEELKHLQGQIDYARDFFRPILEE